MAMGSLLVDVRLHRALTYMDRQAVLRGRRHVNQGGVSDLNNYRFGWVMSAFFLTYAVCFRFRRATSRIAAMSDGFMPWR